MSKTEAYVDTSAFIAFVDRSDSHHVLFRRLFADPPVLVTTTLVVAEGHGWFLRRYDRQRALDFLSLVELLPDLEVCSVGQREFRAAADVLRRYSDQNLTLADAVGIRTMKERVIESCWSTDFHLSLGGARLVIHDV